MSRLECRPVVHHAEDQDAIIIKQLVKHQEGRNDELADIEPYFSEIDRGRIA